MKTDDLRCTRKEKKTWARWNGTRKRKANDAYRLNSSASKKNGDQPVSPERIRKMKRETNHLLCTKIQGRS
jgi:hypothetical protein